MYGEEENVEGNRARQSSSLSTYQLVATKKSLWHSLVVKWQLPDNLTRCPQARNWLSLRAKSHNCQVGWCKHGVYCCGGVAVNPGTLFHCLTSRADIDCGSELLQQGIDAFSRWGHKWRIDEPSKTQAMSIGHHRQPWELPRATFDGTPVSEESRLKLLGVTFDDTLSYSFHLRSLASRANQRIGFLKRASPILVAESRQRVYNGFVRPHTQVLPLSVNGLTLVPS